MPPSEGRREEPWANPIAALPNAGREASSSLLRVAVRLSAGGDAFASSHIFRKPVEHGDIVVILPGRMRGGGGGGGGGGGARPEEQHEAAASEETGQQHAGAGLGNWVGHGRRGDRCDRDQGVSFALHPGCRRDEDRSVSMLGLAATAVFAPRIIRAARGQA
jgi:hypothetical protein